MKKYEYKGKIYCNEDLSCEIDNYGGDLYNLFWAMSVEGDAGEYTSYYSPQSDKYYGSIEDFVENECDYYEVE